MNLLLLLALLVAGVLGIAAPDAVAAAESSRIESPSDDTHSLASCDPKNGYHLCPVGRAASAEAAVNPRFTPALETHGCDQADGFHACMPPRQAHGCDQADGFHACMPPRAVKATVHHGNATHDDDSDPLWATHLPRGSETSDDHDHPTDADADPLWSTHLPRDPDSKHHVVPGQSCGTGSSTTRRSCRVKKFIKRWALLPRDSETSADLDHPTDADADPLWSTHLPRDPQKHKLPGQTCGTGSSTTRRSCRVKKFIKRWVPGMTCAVSADWNRSLCLTKKLNAKSSTLEFDPDNAPVDDTVEGRSEPLGVDSYDTSHLSPPDTETKRHIPGQACGILTNTTRQLCRVHQRAKHTVLDLVSIASSEGVGERSKPLEVDPADVSDPWAVDQHSSRRVFPAEEKSELDPRSIRCDNANCCAEGEVWAQFMAEARCVLKAKVMKRHCVRNPKGCCFQGGDLATVEKVVRCVEV